MLTYNIYNLFTSPLEFFMKLFLVFIIYSTMGWLIELVCCIVEDGKCVNRGFLIGPYCPIHGVGCVSCLLLLSQFYKKPFLVFVLGILIVSLIEYFTSYIMEKIFHARWWDYSNSKFNLNGRIKLSYSILFGLAIVIAMYVINPYIVYFVNMIPNNILYIVSTDLFIIFVLDIIISFKIISNIVTLTTESIRDNTEEIRKRVRLFIKQKNNNKKK